MHLRRPFLAATLLAAAVAAVTLAPPARGAPPQRPRVLRVQPLLDRLGLKLVAAPGAELRAGQRLRAVVVDPRKLMAAGFRGVRAGDAVEIQAVLPKAQAGDAAAADKQSDDARRAAEAAQAELAAQVTVESADAQGNKRKSTQVVPSAPGTGIPTTAD